MARKLKCSGAPLVGQSGTARRANLSPLRIKVLFLVRSDLQNRLGARDPTEEEEQRRRDSSSLLLDGRQETDGVTDVTKDTNVTFPVTEKLGKCSRHPLTGTETLPPTGPIKGTDDPSLPPRLFVFVCVCLHQSPSSTPMFV